MGCLGGCLGRKGRFLLIYKIIDCQLSNPDIAYWSVVGSSLWDLGLPEVACRGAAVGRDLR